MKLHQKEAEEVQVHNMQDGQVAVIVSWSDGRHVGTIVQRYGQHLVCLGLEKGKSFSELFNYPDVPAQNCIVKILSPGTLLEV